MMALGVIGVLMAIFLSFGLWAGIAASVFLGPVGSMLWADAEKNTNSERLASIAKRKIHDEKRAIRKAKREEKFRKQAEWEAKTAPFFKMFYMLVIVLTLASFIWGYTIDGFNQ